MGKINTVQQIYPLVNEAFKECIGETELVLNEDLSNLVDFGKVITATSKGIDNYVEAMIHTVGRFVFVDRVYAGDAPNVYRDAWEYGAVKAKIRMEPPDAIADPAWALQNGQSYDDQIFYQPQMSETLWDKSAVYMIPISFPWDETIKGSLNSAADMGRFIAMIETQISNTRRIQNDALIMRTINNFTAATIAKEYPAAAYDASSGVRAINLLHRYNTVYGGGLSKAGALNDPGFLRFCAATFHNYIRYFGTMNKALNLEGTNKFTPREDLHVVMLKDFDTAVEVNMQSDTYHKELVELPYHETVTSWQGIGTGFNFSDLSKISVKTAEETPHTVTLDYIVGVMFDKDALGITNTSERITTYVNRSGDFYTNRYKYKSSYFNAYDEQFCVFFVA